MQEYYFLFGLGIIWSIFAVVQDLKTREVANWLNFSLIAFALAYRAFYALNKGDGIFFVIGLLGFVLFFVIAHVFYYGRVFAGGDAKLMMGFGVILPYSNFVEFLYIGVIFIFLLFTMGAIWSLIYSVFIVKKNWKKFKKQFKNNIREKLKLVLVIIIVMILTLFFLDFVIWIVLLGFLIFIMLLYYYVTSLDVCMVIMKKAEDLQVGDWLERDLKVGNKFIKKSVHGLNLSEIKYLKKHGKKVLIKDGIPFTIAFLLALIVIGYIIFIYGDIANLIGKIL